MKRALILMFVVACGSSPGASSPSDAPQSNQQVIIEKMPDGSVKKTTITTTTRTVPAPAPAPRPADPWPADPLIKYNVDRINAYRAKKSLPPYLYDQKQSDFALAGSQQLSQDHQAHAHFAAQAEGSKVFGSKAAENQGDPNGVPSMDADHVKNGQKQIDVMLDLMFKEGPGGGHYDNMMSSDLRRVGIGLYFQSGQTLYLTNDFSN